MGFFRRRREPRPFLHLVARGGEDGGTLDITPGPGERRKITIDTETTADGTLHVHGITIIIEV